MEKIIFTKEDFEFVLGEVGVDYPSVEEVMDKFIEKYNEEFRGEDVSGNPTRAYYDGDVVVVDVVNSEFHSIGDVESYFEVFFYGI